jgi:hypothetical protein
MGPSRRLLAMTAVLAGLCAAEPGAEGYRPVAPAGAVHAAVRSSLKAVQDWLDEKDLPSAAQAAQGLSALAHLYARQGSKDDWRSKADALADACTRLAQSARGKDAAACARHLAECRRFLGELAGEPPGPPLKALDYTPRGGTKVWMLLLDGAYTDAKSARDAAEMERLAQALAEEMNAAQYLRPDGRWRRSSREVRAAALAVADRARSNDVAAARAALKVVYQRCEDCHQRGKK